MKKLILTLLCLSALLLPGFTSQDPEMNKAAEVAQAFMEAIIANDTDAMLNLLTIEHRDDFIVNKTADNPFFKVILLFFQKIEYEVIGMEKYDDVNVDAVLNLRLPDFDGILDKAAEKVYAEYGEDISEEDLFAHVLLLLPAMLEDPKILNYTEEESELRLFKEGDNWKIDESFY